MAKVTCKLSEFIKQHEISSHRLAAAMGGHSRYHAILLLCEETQPQTVNLQLLADAMTSLEKLTGKPVTLTDLLDYSDEAT